MLVTPAVIARVVARSVRATFIWSVGAAVGSGVAGLVVSYQASVQADVRLSPGATIVVVLTALFVVVGTTGALVRRSQDRRRLEEPAVSITTSGAPA
jgi:ABC-type Mn2+/Zn2+ transport system permease subunit